MLTIALILAIVILIPVWLIGAGKEHADRCHPFRCAQCGKAIDPQDDDAWVCIQCGGRNRRVTF